MSATPPYLHPFVLPIEPVSPLREGGTDWYLPDTVGRAPAVVFVHGGPVPSDLQPRPTAWPVYKAYGSWAARAGFVGVTFDHGFTGLDALDRALGDIAEVIDSVRAHPRVDPDRLVLWGFSGAGMLLGPWLADPPVFLRGIAASYPACRPLQPVQNPPVTMAEAVATAADLPLLLTRVGLERAEVAETVSEFVAAATASHARLDVIDVPQGVHGFDNQEDTKEARAAIRKAMTWVSGRLRDQDGRLGALVVDRPPVSSHRWRATRRSGRAGHVHRAS